MTRQIIGSGDSKNVLLVFDHNLVEAAKILLIGLRETLSGDIVVHCIVDAEVMEQKQRIESLSSHLGIRILMYLESGVVKHINTNARAKISYEKYFFQSYFSLPPGNILYLDVDIVPVQNIDSLFSLRFTEPFAAVALDDIKSRRFLRWSSVANSGVVLINSKEWARRNFGSKSLEFIVNYPKPEELYDERVLNYLYYDRWYRLNSCFNTTYSKTFFNFNISFRRKISLVHFMGPRKPWTRHYFSPLGYKYLKIYKNRERKLEQIPITNK